MPTEAAKLTIAYETGIALHIAWLEAATFYLTFPAGWAGKALSQYSDHIF
jgi:hypothetical protein